MDTLNFIVVGHAIELDPQCDTSKLVPGGNKNLKAKFKFSDDWNKYVKAAAFYSRLGVEYSPQLINGAGICDIPQEALESKYFKIQIIGKNDNYPMPVRTNKLEICQNGG